MFNFVLDEKSEMRKAKREKKRKKNELKNKERRKKSGKEGKERERERERVKSCGWWVPQCVFNYENIIGNRVLEIENT